MIIEIFNHTLMITVFVFIMMIIVDYVNVLTKGKMANVIRGNRFRQYSIASFFGSTPGCLGAFLDVSFYVRGLISFGAIAGAMIATSGDEAFVMLALFPKYALLLFAILFLLGILSGWIIDKLVPIFKIEPLKECKLAPLHPEDKEFGCFEPSIWSDLSQVHCSRIILLLIILISLIGLSVGFFGPTTWGWEKISLVTLLSFVLFLILTVPNHYLEEHIWDHIFKKHIWKIVLWTIGALFFVHIGLHYFNLEGFIKANIGLIVIISALIGVIPESGPHLVFVMMFSQGIIPFSVLLTSSIVQDGHGILPLLSFSIRDSINIKIFNLIFGLSIGFILYFIGF